jgi:hypothetical protein
VGLAGVLLTAEMVLGEGVSDEATAASGGKPLGPPPFSDELMARY